MIFRRAPPVPGSSLALSPIGEVLSPCVDATSLTSKDRLPRLSTARIAYFYIKVYWSNLIYKYVQAFPQSDCSVQAHPSY